MRNFFMVALIAISTTVGAQTTPAVKAIAYVGKTRSDCPACHTRNAQAFTSFVKNDLKGEIVEVTLDRQTYSYKGLPRDIEAVPAYAIRVNGSLQHVEYGAGGMFARNGFKNRYHQMQKTYSQQGRSQAR